MCHPDYQPRIQGKLYLGSLNGEATSVCGELRRAGFEAEIHHPTEIDRIAAEHLEHKAYPLAGQPFVAVSRNCGDYEEYEGNDDERTDALLIHMFTDEIHALLGASVTEIAINRDC